MQDKSGRSYHHGDLKRVVLETAQDMLRDEKGWQFTLREVARRAGVSHAAPYKHFPDKSALLAELATIGFNKLRAEIATTVARPAKSARAEFLAAAKAYVLFASSNQSLYRLMFSSEVDKAAYRELEEASAGAFATLTDILDRGQKGSAFRKQPVRGQAAAVWALLHGFALLSIDGQLLAEKVGPKPMDSVLNAILEGLEC